MIEAPCHEFEASALAEPTRPTTTLAEFLRRYDDLAEEGEFDGPRYRIRYTQMGEGMPLHVVTGICCTRRLFAPLLVELAKSFRVTIHSFAGVEPGDGSRLKKYWLDDYPADLFALADHLRHDQFGVIGNSYGVSVTVRAMASQPERIFGAMLVGGFVRRPLAGLERGLTRLLMHWPGKLSSLPVLTALDRYNHGRELAYRGSGLLEFFIAESGKVPVRTVAAQILAVDASDLSDVAPNANQPTMILHGEDDRLVPHRHSAELCDLLPNVRVMVVPRCGHLPHLSHPELMAHAAEHFFLPCSHACGITPPPG